MSDDNYHSQSSTFGQAMSHDQARSAGERYAQNGGGNPPSKPPELDYRVWDSVKEGYDSKS